MNVMTVGEWLQLAERKIDRLDAEIIAVHCFGAGVEDRSWLVAHSEEVISADILAAADSLLKRRKSGLPLAYVLAEKEFYGRTFELTPSVLIPRPETENLIELVKGLELKNPRILEIGTGSGCIAITLALEIPGAKVVATDISSEALAVARRNNEIIGADVEFVQADLLNLDLFDEGRGEHTFDVLVANLPYVNPKWDWLDMETLSFEPAQALFVQSENGLALYYQLFNQLAENRTKSKIKYVIVEADPAQHDELKSIAESVGFKLERIDGFGLLFRDERLA